MPIFDIYETEPYSAYSGSYVDSSIFGNFFVDSRTQLTGYTPLGVSNPVTKRRLVSSRANGKTGTYPNINNMWIPGYLIEGFSSGSFLGRPQKFQKFFSENEYYYDSFVPNPIEIHLSNNAELAGVSRDLFASSLLERSGSSWEITPFSNSAIGQIDISISFDVTSINDAKVTTDKIWTWAFPFQSSYKNINRLFKFSKSLPEVYSIDKDINTELPISPASSSNFLGIVVRRSKPSSTEYNSYLLGYMNWPSYAWPPTSTHLNTVGTSTTRDIYNLYFGTGKGEDPEYGRKGPAIKHLADFFGVLISYSVTPRGYKFGLKSVEPESTTIVFRANRYGQFRDILEQRPFSQFYSKNTTTVSNKVFAVDVVFTSGTQVYQNAIDYVTATNPSYNPYDSGIYDYHYRCGQPFKDR